MTRIFQTIARFCLAAWCGIVLFFVGVAIRPIRLPVFESEQRALLANLLFPGFYGFGFVLLGLAWLATLVCRSWWRAGLVGLILVSLTVDYVWIYSPLAEMTRQVWGEHLPPPGNFRDYHVASMVINACGFVLSCGAAVWACTADSGSPRHSVSGEVTS